MPTSDAEMQRRADDLLAARRERPLTPLERRELIDALRALGCDWEAEDVEREAAQADAALRDLEPPAAEEEPPAAPAPVPMPIPTRRAPDRRGQIAIAVLAVLLVLLIPLAVASSHRRARGVEEQCRERLLRLAGALSRYAAAHDGLSPSPIADLAVALAPYGVTADDLVCPLGPAYRVNPMLAGYPLALLVGAERRILVYEADAAGRPAYVHDGRALCVYADGHAAALAPGADLRSLIDLPPAPPEAPPAAPAPASPPEPAPTVAAPAVEPAKPSAAPAAAPAAPPAAATPPAPAPATPAPSSDAAQPPPAKQWVTVLSWQARGRHRSTVFTAGPQARLTWHTKEGGLGAQQANVWLDDAEGQPVRLLVSAIGAGSGTVAIGHEGRFTLRVDSYQPFDLTVEDRQ